MIAHDDNDIERAEREVKELAKQLLDQTAKVNEIARLLVAQIEKRLHS